MLGKSKLLPSPAKASLGSGPELMATVKQPAATPALTPKGAFSTTMPCHGCKLPALRSPAR